MRTGRNSWSTRLSAALLTFAVLNVTVAPCAMAFDEGRHCPNCPPERETARHHGHSETGQDHHGPGTHHEASASNCESLQAQCGDLDESNVDLRTGHVELDSPQPLAAAPFPSAEASVPRLLVPLATGPPPCVSRGSPRLHELHCVYRD